MWTKNKPGLEHRLCNLNKSLDNTDRNCWVPRVCSYHFKKEDFELTPTGFRDLKDIPGLVDVEVEDKEDPLDSEEDDEGADKDESHDSFSAVLGPRKGQDRGYVQIVRSID